MDIPLGEVPDYIKPGLRILFTGFNPSIRSGETGYHFANPSNRFWKILYRSGLTPTLLKPDQGASLLELGYGLTNIVPRPTRAAADISKAEYAAGRELLRSKVMGYRPGIVCYVGKGVYQAYSGKNRLLWGLQPGQAVAGVKDFVAPSSSGLVRMKEAEVIAIYRQLAELINDPGASVF